MERDDIFGALIGLVGATSNSGKTADTDRIVAEAVLAVAKFDDKKSKDEINEVIRKIHDEKYRISPGCSSCSVPCGNTSDRDMTGFWDCCDEEKSWKLDIIEMLGNIAEKYIDGSIPQLSESFYRGIFYLGYDMNEEMYKDVKVELSEEEKEIIK